MFRLVATVKRGSASTLLPTWLRYPTVEAAQAAADGLLREDRVQRVMVIREGTPGTFVAWRDR